MSSQNNERRDPVERIMDRIDLLAAQVERLGNKIDRQSRHINRIIKQEKDIMADLSALTTAVAENTSVEESAIQLLQNLADQLEASMTDPAAIQAIVDNVRNNSSALAAAVAQNTPATSPPPVEPPPVEETPPAEG